MKAISLKNLKDGVYLGTKEIPMEKSILISLTKVSICTHILNQ